MHTLIAHIIENILQTSVANDVNNITLTDNLSGRLVEQALFDAGFQQLNNNLIKPVRKGIIPINEALAKLGLPNRDNCPPAVTDYIELENILWPAKIAGLNIPIYIIPIRAKWAKNLISTAGHQLSLMGTPNAMLQSRRVYYRSKQGINISVPSRIIWYISENRQHGPSKSVIGVSLANEVKTAPAKTLFKLYERFGVYTWKDILTTANNDPEKQLMAIVFSKTEIFAKPIPLSSVSKIIKKHENRTFNPVSPFAVTHRSFEEIYESGTNYGR